MRTLGKVLLVVGVLALMAGTTQAQQRQGERSGGPGGGAGSPSGPGGGGPGGGPGGPGGGLRSRQSRTIFDNESVQKELNLSDIQKTRLKDALAKIREEYKVGENSTREERTKLIAKRNEATKMAIAGILDKKQFKRYNQIMLQSRLRLSVFTAIVRDPELAKDLNLSDEQKKKFGEIASDFLKELRVIARRGVDVQQNDKRLRKKTEDKVMDVLTPAQKKTLKELQGAPFKIELPPRNNDKTDK